MNANSANTALNDLIAGVSAMVRWNGPSSLDAMGIYEKQRQEDLVPDAVTALRLLDDYVMVANMLMQREWYRRKWKLVCPECEGKGEWSESYDPSPAGVSLGSGSMMDSGPCPICVEEGFCPRCHRHGTLNEEATLCSECEWSGPGDGMPERPEWESEYQSQQEQRQFNEWHNRRFEEEL